MFQKALAARPGIGKPVLWTPFMKTVRHNAPEPPAPSGSAASACLSAEEDFELAGEFLDVFTRTSERVVGFVFGCTVIAIIWAVFSLF